VNLFPGSFEYFVPTSVDEVTDLLAQHGDGAKVLAGGQSLIPLMKLRFAAPEQVVDINRVSGLDTLQEDGELRIGALVRHRSMERSELLGSRYPTMAAAAPLISDPLVRNLGTVVGSLCHADPQGDWASVMLAMNAMLVARGKSGERIIPMAELLEGPFTTSVHPDEVVTEVRVPREDGRPFGTYLKLERKIGDFASVGVAVHLSMDGERVKRAGIGLTAVGPSNIKAEAAERALVGTTLTDDSIAEAGRLAAEAARPVSDIRGSADYKREVVRIYVTRALRVAARAEAV
jgi:carbon-monoxide dehydrogenase medium subunit